MDTPSLVLRHAALRGRPGLWTIALAGDRIAAVTPDDADLPADQQIDAAANLVTVPFVNGHLHLCKVHTLDLAGDSPLAEYTTGSMGGAMTAIERAAVVKKDQTVERVVDGARSALRQAIANGVRVVQAFADVDPVAGLTGVDGLIQVREEFRGLVDVQVVAFPQDGLLRAPGTEELMAEAARRGVDVIGGIPWIEYTDRDAAEHVRRMVELAQQHDLRVAMLVDDAGDPNLRTTEMLAVELLQRGMIGRGSAQHARAMATYPEPTFRRMVGLFTAAGMGFVTDPHTGPLHLRVDELLAAGLPVALGQDDIEDAYYPFGRHNMLEIAYLAAHFLGYLAEPQLDILLDMITRHGSRTLGLPARTVEAGQPADLLVLHGRTARQVLTEHAAPAQVIAGGKVVAASSATTRFIGVPQA